MSPIVLFSARIIILPFHEQIEVLHPQPGWVELDSENLWTQFVGVVKEAVQGNHMIKHYCFIFER